MSACTKIVVDGKWLERHHQLLGLQAWDLRRFGDFLRGLVPDCVTDVPIWCQLGTKGWLKILLENSGFERLCVRTDEIHTWLRENRPPSLTDLVLVTGSRGFNTLYLQEICRQGVRCHLVSSLFQAASGERPAVSLALLRAVPQLLFVELIDHRSSFTTHELAPPTVRRWDYPLTHTEVFGTDAPPLLPSADETLAEAGGQRGDVSGSGRQALILDEASLTMMVRAARHHRLTVDYQGLTKVLLTGTGQRLRLVDRPSLIIPPDASLLDSRAANFRRFLENLGYMLVVTEQPGSAPTIDATEACLAALPYDLTKLVIVTHHAALAESLRALGQRGTEVWVAGFDEWDPFLGDIIDEPLRTAPLHFFDLVPRADQFVVEAIEAKAARPPQIQIWYLAKVILNAPTNSDLEEWDAAVDRFHAILGHPIVDRGKVIVEDDVVTLSLKTIPDINQRQWQSLLSELESMFIEPVNGTIQTRRKFLST